MSGRRDWNNPRRALKHWIRIMCAAVPPGRGERRYCVGVEPGIPHFSVWVDCGSRNCRRKLSGGTDDIPHGRQRQGDRLQNRSAASCREPERACRVCRRADSDLLSLEVRTTVEYDGMVRVDLAVEPKREVVVNRLEYAFSLPEKNALYMHFIGCPNVNGLSIMVPSESMSFKVPERDGIFFREPFKTLVWFGDNDKGFLWFSGSEKNFYPRRTG